MSAQALGPTALQILIKSSPYAAKDATFAIISMLRDGRWLRVVRREPADAGTEPLVVLRFFLAGGGIFTDIRQLLAANNEIINATAIVSAEKNQREEKGKNEPADQHIRNYCCCFGSVALRFGSRPKWRSVRQPLYHAFDSRVMRSKLKARAAAARLSRGAALYLNRAAALAFTLKEAMAPQRFAFMPFALVVLLFGARVACGFSSPGAHVISASSIQHHRRSRCASCCYISAPSIASCSICRPVTHLFSNGSSDGEYVVGGEPPKTPSLALKAFRAFKRGMGYVQNRGGTGALVLVSIALLALVYHFGRIWFGKAYALAHCYFTEVYRKSVTPPWEYEATYGCLPPGANPETYGKILVQVDGKYYLKSGGPPDWPVKAGANLSAWSKRQLGIPVPRDWQRLAMLLSFLGGFLIYFLRNT